MAKKKKKKKARKAEVYCHYKGGWIPLGRSRKKCPYCGAAIDFGSHPIKK